MAQELAREAARLISRKDFQGYAALVRRAAEVEDVHERYRSRLALVESGLGAAGQAPHAQVPTLFAATARVGLEILEQEPREPVILNYTGVALYEIGAWNAAELLFKAAARLAPELPHVDSNLDSIKQRRKAGQAPPRVPAPVAVALKDLERQAERCASRAVPVEGLTLSLCMIVKDEEEMLPACLEAIAPAVDEIIVVDTGSTDRTAEIARSFGATVIEHEWNGSFSDARNVSFDAATCDWVMYLDADEVLVAEDRDKLRELTGHTWRETFYLVETNHTGDLDDGTAVTHNALRVFRNRPEYRFEGRIHEQIAQRLPGDLAERFEPTAVRVEHYGYLGVVRDAKEKSRRNIELLERQAAEESGSPFLAFNLGSEYGAIGDSAAALREFQRAWDMLRDAPDLLTRPFVPSLVNRLTKALRVEGRLDAAEAQAKEGLAIYPGFTDLVFEQALVAQQRGDSGRAAQLLRECIEMGDAPSRYSPTVGAGTYLAYHSLADLVEPAEAVELLDECLVRWPSYLGVILPLAAALLQAGRDPEEVAAHVEAHVQGMNASARFMLGTALYEAGAAATAERQFRAVVERQPESAPALLALGECLLSQRRYSEAVEVARRVPESAPLAPAAARSEVFALIVSGLADDAAKALERARAAELPAWEADALGAWIAAALGEQGPARLSAQSGILLAGMLEALLRVEEFDAFAQLVPVIESVDMPWRERRETLAAMYLRRGFLDSAADEWIAACEQEGPDAPALVGLAQIALARGLAEDAKTFAEEALAIDPDNGVARAAVQVAAAA